jgi:Cu-Zn family superoxide dismutase
MKNSVLGLSAILMFSAWSCKDAKQSPENSEAGTDAAAASAKTETVEEKVITLTMEPRSESTVNGTVTFMEKDGKVMMHAEFTGLTPGDHAIHLHESADCSAPDATSTGGHWNPTGAPHGAWGAESGYHKGDIGNFVADETGKGSIHFETDQWCMGCDDATKNIMGKGVIVHQGVDDLTSQPSGAAGARISCTGVIE